MYKNKFVSELPINEVKEYFDELRCKFPLTAEKSEDYAICKERLVIYACKTLEQIDVFDKIKAEINDIAFDLQDIDCDRRSCMLVNLDDTFEIIDKYRKEQTDGK